MSAPALALREVAAADLHRRCAICQTAFAPGEQVGPCPSCGAPFHAECWDENGGCAVYGCERAPAAVAVPAAPPSVWGQEERDCPRCGGRIKMAARRCVHCLGPVAPALPDAGGGAATTLPGRPVVPGLGAAIFLFVAGVVPVTAPLALLFGGAWVWARRRDLRRWPTAVRILAVAAVVTAAAVTLVTVVGLAVHRLTRAEAEAP
jgi:hypothetical protein